MDGRALSPHDEVTPRAWAGLAVVAAACFVVSLTKPKPRGPSMRCKIHCSEPQRLTAKSAQTTTTEEGMGKLDGKVALITGGNSGIGLATAKQFVNEGAYVFITGRREAELAAAVKEIGRHVTGVQGDVSHLGDLGRLFDQIKREKGRLDIVFANAGVAKFAAFGTITEELYDWTFDINVKGLLFTVQKALPLLPDGASIILNSSVVGSKGLPINSVYSATRLQFVR